MHFVSAEEDSEAVAEVDSLTVAGEVATQTGGVSQTGVEASAEEVSPEDVVDPQEVDFPQEMTAFRGTDEAGEVAHLGGCLVVLILADPL